MLTVTSHDSHSTYIEQKKYSYMKCMVIYFVAIGGLRDRRDP